MKIIRMYQKYFHFLLNFTPKFISCTHLKIMNTLFFLLLLLLLLIIIIFFFFFFFFFWESFSHQRLPMVFHWSMSDSKSPQVSRTFLSILADLNRAIVWMIYTCPLIYKSSSPYTNPLVTVSRAPITNGISVTFMFYSFFNSLAKSRYLSFFSLFSILLCDQLAHQSP